MTFTGAGPVSWPRNVDHGVELMMGMMLISGWLSSATWKDASWANHMQKKVARLIPPPRGSSSWRISFYGLGFSF